MKSFFVCLVLFLGAIAGRAQAPATKSSAEIFQEIKKLRVLGSVLYVAAHPDDENTRLIAWLANHEQYRTGYLSLTRGDGGQNLIGDEQGIELGLIRTQELMAARRIDGGEQFFSRAYDFGFSKSAAETFEKWNHETILGDAVFVIRKFQPDVIITRFPEDSRAGHGHHSASAIIAREAFDAAADPKRFPEHFKLGVAPWQAKRILWNTFNFGGGSNTIDSTQLAVEVGHYNALLGRSIGELAGESRSQHKSQGFGVSRQRGTSKEFFVTIKGDKPVQTLLDGVATNWSRIPGGAAIEKAIDQLIARYDFQNPAASIPQLRSVLKLVQAMEPSVWRHTKMKALQSIIVNCAGIYAEAVVQKPEIVSGDTVGVLINVISRSQVPVQVMGYMAGNASYKVPRTLEPNRLLNHVLGTQFSGSIMQTQPYWLREAQQNGLFSLADDRLLAQPENTPLIASILLNIDSIEVQIDQPIQYRFVDPVKAEQYQPVYLTERFLIHNAPGILLFKKDQQDSAALQMNITSASAVMAPKPQLQIKGELTGFEKTLEKKPVKWVGGDVYTVIESLPNYLRGTKKETDQLAVTFNPDAGGAGSSYANTRRSIAYDHIPTQTWHYRDVIKVLHIDLKTVGKRVGYLPGAGDRVAPLLTQMGYEVTELKEADLKAALLHQYDAVITGVRAYNIHSFMATAFPELLKYVEQGGNLIVQYNTNNLISQLKGKMAPYPFSISRTRITNENSPVSFLLPNHPVLNYPNKISEKDFEGWVQERSIYHADGLDANLWQLPLGLTDPGEAQQNGSLAIAPYGKGNFVYTGLVFFRQLPAGVPGAFRLMANLVALPKNK
jgi:LmbE family N-acetylglucosaminyl deacetylase